MLLGWVAQPRLARILHGTESSGMCSSFSTVAISKVVWGRLNWNWQWIKVFNKGIVTLHEPEVLKLKWTIKVTDLRKKFHNKPWDSIIIKFGQLINFPVDIFRKLHTTRDFLLRETFTIDPATFLLTIYLSECELAVWFLFSFCGWITWVTPERKVTEYW